MTITIHRPNRKQNFLVLLGLAALLGALAVAIFQDAKTQPAKAITPSMHVVSEAGDSAAYWRRLELVQDGFLPPADASNASSYWMRLQGVQDGYLPPATAPESNVGSNGLGDSRTQGPR